MAFGFLAALPGILAKGASAVGSGIKTGVTGAAKGVKKVPSIFGRLGEMGNEDEGIDEEIGIQGAEGAQSIFGQLGRKPTARTPGWNPNAGADQPRTPQTMTPRIATPPTMPEAAPGVPGGVVPTPREPSRQEQLDEAQSVYGQGYKKPQGFGQRLGRAIIPALKGAAEGYARTGNLAGAAGGAAVGAGAGILAPRQVYNQEFDERIKPQILERQEREAKESIFAEQRRKAEQEGRYKEAQIGGFDSEAQRRKDQSQLERDKFDFERGKPAFVSPGQGILREGEQTPGYTQPFAPKAPAPAWRQDASGNWIDLNATENQGQAPIRGMVSKGRSGGGGRGSSGGGQSGSSRSTTAGMKQPAVNAMRADLEKFEKAKGDATIQTDPLVKEAAVTEMRAKAQNLADLYGDAVEVGGLGPGEWPYVKLRSERRTAPARSQPSGGKVATAKMLSDYMKANPGMTMEQAIRDAEADGYGRSTGR